MTAQPQPTLAERSKNASYELYLLGAALPPIECDCIWILSLLYKELNDIVNSTTEEMIGHIRLAWWREQIEALHNQHREHDVNTHPILSEGASCFSRVKTDTWADFFSLYNEFLSTDSTTMQSDILPSPLMIIAPEIVTPYTPIHETTQKLWAAGETAIAKVSPPLHYRYDMALKNLEADESQLIHQLLLIYHNFLSENKLHNYNRLERLLLRISCDRLHRLARSNGSMHHPKMMRSSALLPLRLWRERQKP
jgi:hypothetical protein